MPTLKVKAAKDTGTTTESTNNTITDSSKTWLVNYWTDYQVTVGEQHRRIVSNTEDTLTIDTDWDSNPSVSDEFKILKWDLLQLVGDDILNIVQGDEEPLGIVEGRIWLDTSDSEFQGTLFDNLMPIGGNTGQALMKSSDNNYDTEWGDVEALPEGGTTGQALVKNSDTNFDVKWADADVSSLYNSLRWGAL